MGDELVLAVARHKTCGGSGNKEGAIVVTKVVVVIVVVAVVGGKDYGECFAWCR